MIFLINPRATRPENRRFPLSLMAVGAALPPEVSWEIVDGNLPAMDVVTTVSEWVEKQRRAGDPVTSIALTVMPGPQLVSAVPISKALKARFPELPIIWGGNFGSLYPDPVLNAPYVDWLVRGQGEDSFRELLEAIGGKRDPKEVAGIAFRLAAAVGVETPSNLLFAASVLVLLLVAIQLSTEVSRLEEETRTIAERTAILAHRIERLENAGPGSDSAADGHAGEPAGETTATDARETGPDRRDG